MSVPVDGDPVNLQPGPVPLTDRTREAMLGELVSHRSPAFEALHRDCVAQLQTVFRTGNDVVVVNGNGNLGLELAVANAVHPDDRVLCLTNGKFGDNLVDMVRRYTDDCSVVDADWGDPLDLDAVGAAVDESTDLVVMTHCETSTGMLNPVREVAAMATGHGALSLVDGVSSVGVESLPVDDWGVDLAVTASQKCLSAPPGLSAVAVSPQAAERAAANPRTMPYNLDLARYQEAAARDQTPSTAPVHTYRALQRSLGDILDIGLEAYAATQASRADALRRAGAAVGMDVFPAPDADSSVSDTVTVLTVPDGITAEELVSRLADRDVHLRTGIGPTADRTVRAATMSNALTDDHVRRAIGALGDVVGPLVDTVDTAGLTAAKEQLSTVSGP